MFIFHGGGRYFWNSGEENGAIKKGEGKERERKERGGKNMERYVRTMAFSFFFLFFNSTFISRALFLNFLPTLFTNFREFQCIKINCVFHMEYSFSWKKTFRLVITSLQRGNGWNENRIPLRGISHTSGFYNLAMISGYSFEFCRVKSPFRFFPREKRGKLIDAFGYIRLKYIVCHFSPENRFQVAWKFATSNKFTPWGFGRRNGRADSGLRFNGVKNTWLLSVIRHPRIF